MFLKKKLFLNLFIFLSSSQSKYGTFTINMLIPYKKKTPD